MVRPQAAQIRLQAAFDKSYATLRAHWERLIADQRQAMRQFIQKEAHRARLALQDAETGLSEFRRKNRVALNEMNPPTQTLRGPALFWARKSAELKLDEADEADEDTLNRILWHATRGYDTPYPERFVAERP